MPLQILQHLAYAIHRLHHAPAACQPVRPVRRKALKIQILLDIDDGINPEAVQPLVQPPINHAVQLLQHPGIFPVQIRLLLGKHVEIIIIRSLHLFPGAATKIAAVVARGLAIFSLAEIEIIPVLPLRVLQGLLEPLMLVRAMIDDQVHHDIHIPLVSLRQKLIKLLHGTKNPVNLLVISNIIALVHKRRLVNRGNPDNIHPQLLQVVQLADNPPQITDAIPIGIQEALGVNLISHLAMPPFALHKYISPCSKNTDLN